MKILPKTILPKAFGTRPRLAVEIRWGGVVAARAEAEASATGLVAAVSRAELGPEAIEPGLKPGNFRTRAAVVAAVRKTLEAVHEKGTGREVTLVVPDAAVRVSLLDFDTLPAKAAEALPVVRFRLKKLLPFDADEAQVSYQVMGGEDGTGCGREGRWCGWWRWRCRARCWRSTRRWCGRLASSRARCCRARWRRWPGWRDGDGSGAGGERGAAVGDDGDCGGRSAAAAPVGGYVGRMCRWGFWRRFRLRRRRWGWRSRRRRVRCRWWIARRRCRSGRCSSRRRSMAGIRMDWQRARRIRRRMAMIWRR